jgi:aminoglycoside/choline kinase family phosphotransferase
VRPFLHVANLLQAAGVHVPRAVAEDVANGYLLLTDLGTQTFLDVLNEANANDLFDAAIDALIKWQLASKPGVLPPYDEALLRRELSCSRLVYRQTSAGHIERRSRPPCSACSTRSSKPIWPSPVYVHRDTCRAI